MADQAPDNLGDVVQLYLDALYTGNVEIFRFIFHPAACLYSVTEGELKHLSVDDYLTLVANRPSPEEKGDKREDEILSITQGSPTTAHARVKDVYLPKKFVDELSFVHVGGRWQIIAKVWHYTISEVGCGQD